MGGDQMSTADDQADDLSDGRSADGEATELLRILEMVRFMKTSVGRHAKSTQGKHRSFQNGLVTAYTITEAFVEDGLRELGVAVPSR